jgi:hypothetical protein
MGEFSKRIGEIGEEIVVDFLNLIGWSNPQRNFDIPSINPEKHGKKNHGIDGFFHYRSPMITNTLENVLISSKFSKDPYPNNPASKFKDYYLDLAIAIESFKKSELRSSTLNQHSRLDAAFDRGLIFWLNNTDIDSDLLSKLLRIETPKGVNHDGIYLVDNKRIEFIFDSLQFVKRKLSGCKIEFAYFNSGLNSDDTQVKNGSILPIQYINASILPFRAYDERTGETTFILTSTERFQQDELVKLMGLAKNIGANMQSNTFICFPDYNKVNHEQIVENTKQVFDDPSFTSRLTVYNYNTTFRG